MDTTAEPLFLDGEALVIDKAAGLPVTRPRNRAFSVEDMAPALRFGFQRPPAVAHRLDRDTSGCLLLARNPKALVRFMGAFERGEVDKAYLAIVAGDPGTDGTIELPLAKISSRDSGWRMRPDPSGKRAVTRWRRLAVRNGNALLLMEPATGRTHQLRVHAAAGLGLPIVGDPLYGRESGLGMMLHAWKLAMPRAGKEPIVAEAPLPARFGSLGFDAADGAG